MIKSYTFKLISTGESFSILYSDNITLCEFLYKIKKVIKRKYFIDSFQLIKGGTNLGELGYEYNFNSYPTRITTLREVFNDTVAFYIRPSPSLLSSSSNSPV